MIGYTTTGCMGGKPQPSYVAVTSIRTGKTVRWTVPGGGLVDSVSMTADGGELCYSLQDDPSGVRIIPTTAAPGSAADRGRTVVAAAAQFGPSEWVSFAAITPDGKAVYFTTYPETSRGPGPGQVRVVDLATGRTRLVYAPAGSPGLITVDPLVRYLLLQTGKLVLLDLATGKIGHLPSGFLAGTSGLIWW
jgi:DNA-binding beta-propeller fold protein YncE